MSEPNDPIQTRKSDGTFSKGASGNPKGRPKTETVALRKQIAPQAEAIIRQVIDQALEGDLTAAKLILDRILPPLKPVAAPVIIPFDGGESLVDQAKAILSAASSGQISSDIAAQLIQSTSNLTRIIEFEDLKDRLEALERITKK
ncbi:DUF5681 domain-containing protein [Akkermansiaceae bacterium]|nr:DUF5681 domain-containing protein [Akkermansiaceae bacterium]MDB4142940.1 DUF5681 domain-containing protein [Akkermansiaceae bacterium]MDB4313972.1 DUF5681 domain-containing protein [Akkermansiaceae bacterium]